MKKLLVSVSVVKGKGSGTAAIVVDVPDLYEPINDSPDADNPFPRLRRGIYDAVKNRPEVSKETINVYKPDNCFILSITVLGYVDTDTGKTIGTMSMSPVIAKSIGESL